MITRFNHLSSHYLNIVVILFANFDICGYFEFIVHWKFETNTLTADQVE